MNFEKNERGGYIVPQETKIEEGFEFPDFSEFGSGCKIGSECRIGSHCEFGQGCRIGSYCKVGSECKIGSYCEFGRGCRIGQDSDFGPGCEFGQGCRIGSNCKIEGVIVEKLLTISNVDGTGRQLLIIWHSSGVKIRAGCFIGSDNEFLEKAKSEGKERYVRVIGAILEAEKNEI